MMTQSAELPAWMAERVKCNAGVLELAPDEARSFSLFVSLDTQWNRHALTGGRTGINYAVVPAVASMMDIKMTPAMLVDVRIMEAAALSEFARKAR